MHATVVSGCQIDNAKKARLHWPQVLTSEVVLVGIQSCFEIQIKIVNNWCNSWRRFVGKLEIFKCIFFNESVKLWLNHMAIILRDLKKNLNVNRNENTSYKFDKLSNLLWHWLCSHLAHLVAIRSTGRWCRDGNTQIHRNRYRRCTELCCRIYVEHFSGRHTSLKINKVSYIVWIKQYLLLLPNR